MFVQKSFIQDLLTAPLYLHGNIWEMHCCIKSTSVNALLGMEQDGKPGPKIMTNGIVVFANGLRTN